MTALDREWATARILLTNRYTDERRALWATWSDELLQWQCHVAGFAYRPHVFTASRQGSAQQILGSLPWIKNYRARLVRPGLWDNRPDVAMVIERQQPGDQFDLFGFDGFLSESGGVGVCRSAEGAGTPRTPLLAVCGFVTPTLSLTNEKNGLRLHLS